jgi:predicted CoA-substrate-specific enzyme activase
MRYAVGVDIGSISAKMAIVAEDGKVLTSACADVSGSPADAIKKACAILRPEAGRLGIEISAAGATGSGRNLARIILGADIVKNEVTAQTVGVLSLAPDASTIIEIGGQDSKIILLKDSSPVWNNLNTLCAAGTGSFLASQAARLGVPVEKLGEMALSSSSDVHISARCTVFSESDMIHKAALGYKKEDIVRGLCRGLVRNYLNNVAKNRKLNPKVVFVGGVAANRGVVRAFEEELKCGVTVPAAHRITGCIGMALLALKGVSGKTAFGAFEAGEDDISPEVFTCPDCSNGCQVAKLKTARGERFINSLCEKYG